MGTRAGIAIAVALALAAPAAGARPRTLAYTGGPVYAFAQDGGRIAWASLDDGSACPWKIRVRTLATHVQTAITTAAGPTCRDEVGFQEPEWLLLALAGRRAAWTLIAHGNNTYRQVVTGAVAVGADRQVVELVYANGDHAGDHLGGVAGDGRRLLFSRIEVGVGPTGCEGGDGDLSACYGEIRGGGVYRIEGAAPVAVPGAPPAIRLAVSGDRLALVPAARARPPTAAPRVAPLADVQIRALPGGGLVSTFAPAGTIRSLALSGRIAAVIVRRGALTQIDAHDPATGARVRTVTVPATATALSVSGTRLVYRTGRRVWMASAVAGGPPPRLLATAAAEPIGLSIEGTRVAWAENLSSGGRIQAVDVRP